MNTCSVNGAAITRREVASHETPRARPDYLSPVSAGRVALSAREREVLVAWLKTDSKTAVAKELYLTASTVRTHLQRIREKYARAGRPARTKAALAARAIQDGYITLGEL